MMRTEKAKDGTIGLGERRIRFSRGRYGLFGPASTPGCEVGMELMATGSLEQCIDRAASRRGQDEWLLIMTNRGAGWEELARYDRFRLRQEAHRRGHIVKYAVEEPLPPAFLARAGASPAGAVAP